MPDESPFRAVHAAGIFLKSLLIMALVLGAGAISAHDLGQNEPPYSQTVYNRLQFSEVEMISRNHNIGTYRGGPLVLKAWVSVEDGVYVGVDEQGRLLQVLQLSDRTVAFLLSGDLFIQDFVFQNPSRLVGIGSTGQVYLFDWTLWSKSLFPKVLRRAIGVASGTVCVSWLACLLSSSVWGLPPDSWPVLMQMGALTVTVFTVQGMLLANHFQVDNDSPSGLVPTGEPISGYKSLDYIYGRQGQILDVELKRRAAPSIRLSQVLQDSSFPEQNFFKTCEHELLARGVPFEKTGL